MLNSATNRRLSSNFDAATAARRRSSATSGAASRRSSTFQLNNDNKLTALNRQVHRIYHEEENDNNAARHPAISCEVGNHNSSTNRVSDDPSLLFKAKGDNDSIKNNKANSTHHYHMDKHYNGTKPSNRQRRKSSFLSSKQNVQHVRCKSRTRYSISNKVYPSINRINDDHTKDISSRGENASNMESDIIRSGNTNSNSMKKQRRGSRLMPSRYSIARKIRKHQKEIEKQSNFQDTSRHLHDSSTLGLNNNDDNDPKEATQLGQLNSDIDMLHHKYHHLGRRTWFIVLPSNKYRIAWDIFMAWLLASMAFYVPFRVCMYWDDQSTKSAGLFWFELFTDVSFGVDILMNFITAYHDPNTKSLVCSSRKIAKRYITGYFVFDLVATIPFGYILSSSNGNLIANKIGKLGRLPRMVRFLKAIRLLKLLRVYKLKDFITKLETDYGIHHGITRLIKIISAVVLVTHLAGCFWHLVGLTGGTDSLEGGWIYRYSFTDKAVTVRYIASLYWSFSTLTTVGYGDISGRTPQEQCYSMLMMLLGVSWYAYIVSSMATIMSTFDATSTAVREKMVCVNEFIRGAKLPHHLGRQIRSFFEFKLAKSQRVFLMNKHYDADEILYELSSSLRAEIMLYMECDLIAQIPFFDNKVNQFVADTVSMLQPIIVNEGEYIVKEGSQADEMFFLTKGTASVLYGQKPILSLQEGSYFGEIGCLVGGIRRASVKAQTTCELQALSRKNLNILVIEYPDVGFELRNVAKDRAKVVKEEHKYKGQEPFDYKQINGGSSEAESNTLRLLLEDHIVDAHLEEVMNQFHTKILHQTD